MIQKLDLNLLQQFKSADKSQIIYRKESLKRIARQVLARAAIMMIRTGRSQRIQGGLTFPIRIVVRSSTDNSMISTKSTTEVALRQPSQFLCSPTVHYGTYGSCQRVAIEERLKLTYEVYSSLEQTTVLRLLFCRKTVSNKKCLKCRFS